MILTLLSLSTKLGRSTSTMLSILKLLGLSNNLSLNFKVPSIIAKILGSISDKDMEFLAELQSCENSYNYKYVQQPTKQIKVVGYMNLDKDENKSEVDGDLRKMVYNASFIPYSVSKKEFWIEELLVSSKSGPLSKIKVGTFDVSNSEPLYSVLIGNNGVGKSSLMRDIVDFFIDLNACIKELGQKLNPVSKCGIRCVKYHIDGVSCEVTRLERTFLAKIEDKYIDLNSLRLPSIIGCHFGAFEKLPIQKVNGTASSRYDVDLYKYVGAHVNGAIISSSAISFRLLFALSKGMNNKQLENICSILDFIGYDHKISLHYEFVLKSKKGTTVRDAISQRVDNDKEFCNWEYSKRARYAHKLQYFYGSKTKVGEAKHSYNIDIDNMDQHSNDTLHFIYKLRQYDFIKSNCIVTFYKNGVNVPAEEMSSGEFAMLSTVLSVSAEANDTHTLVLLDEPELSLHPNWQMTFIDNMDLALKDNACHLLIGSHSHMLVSDLPLNRSCVIQLEKDKDGVFKSQQIAECTYGWSAEEVLLKVFKTATDRNRYFGERIGKLLEQMGNNTISPEDVADELDELQEISRHLSDVDPMKQILNTIVRAYK